MNTSTLGFKLSGFLATAVAIAALIGAGMYGLLRKVQTDEAARMVRVIAAKNTAYELFETVVDAQAALQESVRLKDPDEIEKSVGHFKVREAAARQLIKATADLPPAVNEKMAALAAADQQVIDRFLLGDNSAAFELMMTEVPTRFDALLVVLREHSAQVEAAVTAETAAHQAELNRILLAAVVICTVLVVLLVAFGWRFRQTTTHLLQGIAGSLVEASDQVASAAGQVSSSSQSLAEGSSEQAASLEETSSSLEEMSSMTKRNAENAGRANELTRQARTAADTGASDMQAMDAAMKDIKTSSDDIAKIIKTIDEIAFQTNILALNAAVEAARAGEAGAGFAVVAEEVRNLAQRSATAAKETAAKIEAAIGKSSQGVEISGKVAARLGEIVDKVRQVDALIGEVATASGEQNDGVQQINTAVGQMDKVVQSNAAAAEESAAAAQELNAQAAMLKHTVSDLQKLAGQGAGVSHQDPPAVRKPAPAPQVRSHPARANPAVSPSPVRKHSPAVVAVAHGHHDSHFEDQ
jgi:methyl-accepting chemotaxis protein